jgi:hypothetical protein
MEVRRMRDHTHPVHYTRLNLGKCQAPRTGTHAMLRITTPRGGVLHGDSVAPRVGCHSACYEHLACNTNQEIIAGNRPAPQTRP